MKNPFPTNPFPEDTKVLRISDWPNFNEVISEAESKWWKLMAISNGRAHFTFIPPEVLNEE